MIGKLQFEIAHEDFAKGMNTQDDLNDGGWSALSTGISPLITPGWITASGNQTDLNGVNTFTGSVIASCEDPNYNGNDRVMLTNAGEFIVLKNSAFTTKQTDVTNTYISGRTDLISFNNEFFATSANGSNDNITKLTSTLGAIDKTWWTTTMSQAALNVNVKHPMQVWASELYVGDGRYLHKIAWNGSAYTVVNGILSLSAGLVITALGVDPGTGKLLVAVSNAIDNANTKAMNSYIGLYGGYSPTQFIREIPVEEQINAFYNLSGKIFVTYGQNLGLYTGSGTKFLRKLKVTLASTNLATKHHITSINNTLYVIEDKKLLAYGEVVGNSDKVFWYPINDQLNNLDCIFNAGSHNLAFCFAKVSAAGSVYLFDTLSGGTSTQGTWYSLSYHMPRPVHVRGIDVHVHSALTSGSHVLSIIDDKDNVMPLKTFDSTTPINQRGMNSFKTTTIQVKDVITNTDVALERVIIYYDIAE